MFDENGKFIGEEELPKNAEPVSEERTSEPAASEFETETAENNEETTEAEDVKSNSCAEEKFEQAVEQDFKQMYEQPAPKKKSALKTVAFTGLCAALAGVIFAVSSMGMGHLTGNPSAFKIGTTQEALQIESTEAVQLNYSDSEAIAGELSIEDIAIACLPSVVSITSKGVYEIMTFFGNYQTESNSSGSGIIIGQNDTELLIVTNYHVVSDSKELTVVFSHEENEAKSGDASYMNVAQIKGYDADKDIAVIAVKLNEISEETKSKIKIAAIGDSDAIKLGSGVVAIGNALGYGQSVTHGIISAVNREVTMEGVKGGETTNAYIQTDAAINAGNSGGALLNMKGELIGINTAKISSTGVEGMGYAIPITDVEELINELMNLKTREVVDEENRGYLGIYGVDVTTKESQAYGMPVGVFVQETIEGSPADKSDLQQGDIIVKVDNVSVTSMSQLQTRLAYYSKGETVTLTVKRTDGRRYGDVEVSVKLGSKSEAKIDE